MLLNLIKKIPIDFGQGSVRYTTKGKLIALDFILKDGFGKNALDVGCRSGHFSKILEEMGYNVTSIDIEKNYEKCQLVDANKPLLYKNSSFDLIWCSEIIEHLDSPQRVLGEFKRMLKPEGKAVFTTPNSQFWLFRILKLFGLPPQKIQRKDHIHFFGIKDILILHPYENIVYGFFPYFILKFRIKKMVNLLSPTFVFIIKKYV